MHILDVRQGESILLLQRCVLFYLFFYFKYSFRLVSERMGPQFTYRNILNWEFHI